MEEIEVRNVSKDFLDASGKPFHAIRDISFTWVKGENISFTGESGSGKSTMARLLIGLERPTSGEILLMARTLPNGVMDSGVAIAQRYRPFSRMPLAA